MSDSKFIKNEEIAATSALFQLNWRLFRSLPLFWKLLPFTVICILLASAVPAYFRWYAGKYSTASESEFTLYGIIWIVFAGILFRIAAWMLFEATGMWSSQTIYSDLVKGLSRTRTTFFDENPSGRIINRMIRDYDELRSTAIIFVGDFFNAMIEVFSIAAVACFASPWAMVMVIPLFIIFFFAQAQRSIMIEHCRALSAIANSHVINRKNDLIEGRDIYILYGKSNHLLERMTQSLRTYLQASILTFKVDIWASFWIRFSSECFSLFVLFFMIYALNQERIDIPIAGVIISALFGITGSMGWLDYATSLISRSAPHLQRIFEYVDLPAESSTEFAHSRPRSTIGSRTESGTRTFKGDIVFKDYSMSYREGLPLILKGLNLNFKEGSKTALIGRTGSGKSSVIQALLRMVHVHHGDIQIGNQSVLEGDIHQLRRHFGVVPQVPYLFEGTIATNLDRGRLLKAHLLQKAMDAIGLHYSLNHPITEGGQNLSVGERQLICLARVIACNRSIILMDEPTSGLDPETDARIHWILHTALKEKTVITIAHRKDSIRNYDSVIEIAGGTVLN